MKAWKQILPKALVIFLIFTVVCGIFYTGAVTGLAQLLFPDQANGSIIESHHIAGSRTLLPPIMRAAAFIASLPLR